MLRLRGGPTAGLKFAIHRAWLWLHQSGTYVKLTQAGADFFARLIASRCEDCGWVCQNHPEQRWQGLHACDCDDAGAPCPARNSATGDEMLRLPFTPDDEGREH